MEVQGFEELSRKLQQLPDKVINKVVQSATTSAIREGAKEIRKSAPKGQEPSTPQKKYGYKPLRKSIKVKRLKPLDRYERAAKIDTGDAFWATFYELGTSKQPARPFFANAFRRSEARMIAKLAEKLGLGIEKEAMK